jgi:hypothetical protein
MMLESKQPFVRDEREGRQLLKQQSFDVPLVGDQP